jgi:CelD/BcsL family acetyltransferase involved in cellulose biosynthesis
MSNEGIYQFGRFDSDLDEWDGYVLAHPEGRFCHLTAYHRAVRASYGLKEIRFALRREGRLCGLLAVGGGRSAFFGRKWISMPFSEYGGFLLDPDVPEVEARRLAVGVIAEARRASTRSIEINGALGLFEGQDLFARSVPYEAALLDLSPGPERLFEKVVTYEVRKAVRKAESKGLTTREASDIGTIRNVFYPLHLDSMRRLCVPPHGLNYFEELKNEFGDDLQIFWAERDGEKHAGLLGIRSGQRVQIFATVSRPDSWEDRPNDLAHWAYIRWACAQGARWFDFGSVRYEGQRRFKKKWGVTFHPAAHWIADLSGGKRMATFDSSSEALSLTGRIWSALVPTPATQWLGPIVRRQLLR